jgi:phytoene synthase
MAISQKIFPPVHDRRGDLDLAYDHCTQITRLHSPTFHLASGLLEPEARRAVRALYAFCRVSDDLVDRETPDRLPRFEAWRRESLADRPAQFAPVPQAWADARARHRIPRRLAEQLLDGIAQDLAVSRYNTFEDLVIYCYGVASTVGLMTMHIVGYTGEAAIPYAIKLGVALQLTNILRDVREDWDNGRLYLPLEELAAYGLTEADVAAGAGGDRWRRFMRFQIARARGLFSESLPGIGMLGEGGRFAVSAAAGLYRGILDDIEAHDYDVFTRRAHVSGWGKLQRLPGIWLRTKK